MNKNKKWIDIAFVILSYFAGVGFFLMYYFFYFNLSDAPQKGDSAYLIMLITMVVLCTAFLVTYLLNFFKFKQPYVHKLMNVISFGLSIFFLSSILIQTISLFDDWAFDKNNISLFVSSSFTLLGFGLTIIALISAYLVGKVKSSVDSKEQDFSLFYIIIPYSLLFTMGLVFSIASLLNIQFADTSFYKTTIFQSLFYSTAQILIIVFAVIKSFFSFLVNKIR